MARIIVADMKREDKSRNQIHEVVYGTFTTFQIGDESFFQLDTYGSGSRENPGKISQSIQIDRQSALALIELVKREMAL